MAEEHEAVEAVEAEETVEGRSAPGSAPESPVEEKKGSASNKAIDAVKSIDTGALKKHKQVKQEIAATEQHLTDLKNHLDETEQELGRRKFIEENYDQIISEQTNIRDSAQKVIDECDAKLDELYAEIKPFQEQLNQMVTQHESQLMPYKTNMDNAQVEVDQAQSAVDSAESEIRRLDRKISSAQSDLNTINKEADRLRNSQTEALDYTRYQTMHSEYTMKLQSAMNEKNMASMQLSNAQNMLMGAQGRLQTAQNAYNTEKAKTDEIERPLRQKIAPIQNAIDATAGTREEQSDIRDEAISSLDNANDVHEHPEVIQQLTDDAEQTRVEIAQTEEKLGGLRTAEQGAAAEAKKLKLAIAAVIGIVVVIAIIVVLISSAVAGATELSAQEAAAQMGLAASSAPSALAL